MDRKQGRLHVLQMRIKLQNRVIFCLTHMSVQYDLCLLPSHKQTQVENKNPPGRTEQMLFHEAKENTGFGERWLELSVST